MEKNPIIPQNGTSIPATNVTANDPGLNVRTISLEPLPAVPEQPTNTQQPPLQESHLFGLGVPLDVTASTSSAYTDVEKSIGNDGRGSIVGYDIFQELEERLQEVLSRNDAGPAAAIKIQDKPGSESEPSSSGKEKDIKKVNKVNAALESINRFLSFYLFRSTLYPKRW
ncbi:hypothetical protein quinque_000743 [Culex quinquefasciatus]